MEVGVYQVNENNTARRACYFHLVSGVDGITPATGEAGGQPYISVNGAAGVTTIDTLHAVDTTNLPGLYYITLDKTAEIGTYGFIVVRYKSANTAEFQVIAQVVADSPYERHTGPGLSLPSGLGKGIGSMPLGKKDMVDLVRMFWDYILDPKNKISAKEVLLRKSEFDPEKEMVMIAKDDSVMNKLMEVSDKIDLIKIKDYEDSLVKLLSGIDGLGATISKLPQNNGVEIVKAELATQISSIRTEIAESRIAREEFLAAKDSMERFQKNIDEANTAIESLAEATNLAEKLDGKIDDLAKSLDDIGDLVQNSVNVGNVVSQINNSNLAGEVKELKQLLIKGLKTLGVAMIDANYSLMSRRR